jgi:hypothetical protein
MPLLTQNCLKLTIPGFPSNLGRVSCGDLGYYEKHRSSLAWKLCLKVPLLPLRPSCPSANYSAAHFFLNL